MPSICGCYTASVTVIPKLLRQTSNSLPFYKYIEDTSYEILPTKIRENIKTNFNKFKSPTILRTTIRENSIQEIIDNPRYKTYNDKTLKIAYLDEDQIDIEQLHSFLKQVLEDEPDCLTGVGKNFGSNTKRLIKMYDWLRYNKKQEANPDSVPN